MDGRTFQTFEVVTTRARSSPLGLHIWRALYDSFPAITNIYRDVQRRPVPKELRRLNPEAESIWALDWTRTFEDIFTVRSRRGSELVPVADRIVADGVLNIVDLGISILQSGSIRDEPDPITRTRRLDVRKPSQVVRHLLRGMGRPPEWNQATQALINNWIADLNRARSSDESIGQQQFVLFHDGASVRVRPFGVLGSHTLVDHPLPDGSLWVARANALQESPLFSQASLLALEDLINRDALERDYQMFFEANPEFITTLGPWRRMHSQLVLQRDDGGALIPDLFLERLDSNFCDVLDLKRASAGLVRRQKNRARFRDAVMEAVSQLRHYRDWFEDKDNRSRFRTTNAGLDAFMPRAVVVIGRSQSYYDDVERTRMEVDLPPWVTLRTYDDILANVRRWRALASQ